VFVDCKGGGDSCKDDTIHNYLETAMKFINQYSFVFVAVFAFLILGVFTLRGGLRVQHLIALGALSLGIILAYRFLNPGSGSSGKSEMILAEIQSGSPVLLEFQSPY
jgi:hypothetical protein